MNWHSKRGAHFHSTPLPLAWCLGPGNEVYGSRVRRVVLDVLTADAHHLAKSTATGAEGLQCQDTTQEFGDFLGTCVGDGTTHYTEPRIWSQTPPEIGDVDRDERWSRYCSKKQRDSFVEDDRMRA
jgi:hypothetical protein